MSPKNISSFGQYFRRLATLNFNHIPGVIQLLALCTSDQVGLYQLSKNCLDCGEGTGRESHISTDKIEIQLLHTSTHTHLRTEVCSQM